MKKFRNDILSMMKKHSGPTYFLAVSFADSLWPEGFIAAANGNISIEKPQNLSRSERADSIARNTVVLTKIWKQY